MQRVRTFILIFGLLAILFVHLRVGLDFHKGLAHPVGNNAVVVYKADSQSNAPTVPILIPDIVKGKFIETDQKVNVYLFYSYDKKENNELTISVLLIITITIVFYLSTFVIAQFLPK
jgi:hypothetical protein